MTQRREPKQERDARSVQAEGPADLLSLLVHCQGNPEGHDCPSPLQVGSVVSWSVCMPQCRLCSAISSSGYQQTELIVVIIHHWAFSVSPWKGVHHRGVDISSPFCQKSSWQLARCILTAKSVRNKGTGARQGCVLGCAKEEFIPPFLYSRQHCRKR